MGKPLFCYLAAAVVVRSNVVDDYESDFRCLDELFIKVMREARGGAQNYLLRFVLALV
jgi:hypothetical protein